MPVNISNEELDIFNKNGFTDDDVRATIENYRSQGLDDNTIRGKIDEKLNTWNIQEPLKANATKNYVQNWDKNGDLYYTDEQGNRINDKKPNWFQKYPLKWAKEHYNELKYSPEKRQDLLVDIASLPIFEVGKGTEAVLKGANLLRPLVGKKIGQNIAEGTISGGFGSGLTGLAQGYDKTSEHPYLDAFNSGAIGTLIGVPLGGILGGISGYVGKTIDAKKIKPLENKKKLSAEERKIINKYYSDYNVGKNVINKNTKIGKIELPSEGMKETIKQQPQKASEVVGLDKALENADYINVVPKEHENKYGSDKFYHLKNKNSEYIVANNPKNNKKYFHIIKDLDLAEPKSDGQSLNNIISDVSKNLNPKSEYFGKAVTENIDNIPYGEIKASKLPQTMEEKGTLPPELIEEFKNNPPEYEVLHNKDLQNQAAEKLSKGFNEANGELQNKLLNEKAELTALDFETARQMVTRLYQGGRIEEATALTRSISQKASKAGQSVQALSLWSKTTPEGALKQAQDIVDEYNRTAKKKITLTDEQINNITELAKNIQKTETGTRENQVATQLLMKNLKELIPANIGNKLRTLQNISLLLNPKTFERNVLGNSLFAGLENTVTKPVAAALDSIASIKTKQKTRVLPQNKEYLGGLKQGFKEGAEDVSLGINTRDKLGTRFNLDDKASFTGVPVLEQLEKALGYSLQVPDRMFYQAAFNESIANQIKAAGIEKPTAKMVNNATQEALEAVFQNNSALGNAVLKLRQGGNELLNLNGYGIGDAFIPYAQTPANIAQQGINYSPLGLVNAVKSVKAGNQRQATLDAARSLVGSGLMGLGLYGAKTGLINPDIQDNQVKKNYEALGIRPNTINMGDYNVSYNQLQPLAAPISGGAALADMQNGDYLSAVDRSLQSIADLGMLQTVNKFMSDLNESGLGTATTNMVGSVPSRFVPTGLKQINDLLNNEQKDTYDVNPIRQGFNQALAKLPYFSNNLPAKYDITGQPVSKYQTEGVQRMLDATVNPVFVNKKKSDATLEKLTQLYEETGDKSVLLPIADKNIKFKDLKGNSVSRKLNASERNNYQQQLGVLNKQILDDIVNTEFFDNLDMEEKIKLITDIKRYNKGYVDEKLWDKPSIQKRNLIKKYTQTEKEKLFNEVLKMYKREVLPLKTKQVYSDNFEQ